MQQPGLDLIFVHWTRAQEFELASIIRQLRQGCPACLLVC